MAIEQRHIAIVCNYELLPNRIGGMDYFFWAFDAACKKEGIAVDWFFPNTANFKEYKNLNIIPNTEQSVEAHFTSYIAHNTIQYSHVVTHFVELCTSFYKTIKKKQHLKIIAVDHNPRPLNGYTLQKRLKKRVKGILYSQYIDIFVGVSNYTCNAILKDFGMFLKPKTITIYNGVLLKDIIPKTAQRTLVNPRFLVVSHLRFSKGIQDLIQAVVRLPEVLKADLIIDVYGDGPYKAVLEDKIKSLRLHSVFAFKGSVNNLPSLYKDYDYLLQPTHMECFSLSVLESLAANIPVITTPVGGNEEVITHGDNGYIFNAKKSEELAELLEAIITGKQTIVGPTRPLIENHFSIEKMVEGHLELLN
ncbi:glycosyltransferase family 4 protein [Bizionia gelidisalsuginis]|uniref:Glycosyltransferase family 4 protein n=1 Tax=Bizionia gelidisalsuginis TaxID=291188 RepID=A0ABY3MDE2_9FLAO|nr:glycosyltransferase family 4 protein [Bizionia gelidisalsuginis]TYC17004.1 glycosyltransferase family 4 protein [Bizionia gelidisalsuginis]